MPDSDESVMLEQMPPAWIDNGILHIRASALGSPSVGVRQMSSLEVGWLTGLFEGEGNFGIQRDMKAVRLAITISDLDVLERVAAVTGIGTIQRREPRPKPGYESRKICYTWRVSRRERVAYLIRLMYPLLSQRRQARADELLAAITIWNTESAERSRIKHGTNAGYNLELRRGLIPCPECRQAKRADSKKKRQRALEHDPEGFRQKENANRRAAYRRNLDRSRQYQREWYRKRRAKLQRREAAGE